MLGVLPQGADAELVHILGEVEDLVVLFLHQLGLGQVLQLLPALAAGVVDDLLLLLHPGDILRQGHRLFLLGGGEKQQVLQEIGLGAVGAVHPEFQLETEGFKEFLVLLPVVFQHQAQLAGNFLFQPPGDEL